MFGRKKPEEPRAAAPVAWWQWLSNIAPPRDAREPREVPGIDVLGWMTRR
jgi:hypothetical protein